MKQVLVVYFSQTGQLGTILRNIVSGIEGPGVNVSYYRIAPQTPFPFPWTQKAFYGAFPESFQRTPQPILPPEQSVLERKYDLVILGYQVWFLTPSIPTNSFLKSGYARKLLQNTPVITVVACRNMWIMAQEKMKSSLKDLQARHVGHIALVDHHINHISVITISHWMFSGRKDRYLGIFPRPGVSDNDMDAAKRFGPPIAEALALGDFTDLQNRLLERKAVHINPSLVLTDQRGNVLFGKWARLITKKGGPGSPKRAPWIALFKFYLLFAIWVIAPIVFIVFLLTYLPRYQKHMRDRKYYSSVTLKEN